MLTIRDSQLDVFSRSITAVFLGRLAAYLTDAAGVPAEQAPPQALASLASAREFNVITESGVAEFACIVCRRLGGFPLRPLPKSAQNILLAYGIPAADRLRDFAVWAEQKDPVPQS